MEPGELIVDDFDDEAEEGLEEAQDDDNEANEKDKEVSYDVDFDEADEEDNEAQDEDVESDCEVHRQLLNSHGLFRTDC